jgi:hypothetical protein
LFFRLCCLKSERQLRNNPRKRVLLCVRNQLMYGYVSRVWEAYNHKDEYEVYLCYIVRAERALFVLYKNIWTLARAENLPVIPHSVADKINWDLIICAAPNDMSFSFKDEIPKVMIQHALVGTKIVRGCWYPYIPHFCFKKNGEAVFNSIFETNQYMYDIVVKEDSRFASCIDMAGGLAADQLLSKKSERDSIRREMGFVPDDFVILVQSTFADSLMEDFGVDLFRTCRKICDEKGYKFIISLHPEHLVGEYSKKHPWGKRAEQFASPNFVIKKIEEPSCLSAIACDLCVSDHSSMCFYAALLDNPLVLYMPPKAGIAVPILQPLLDACPSFERIEDLESVIEDSKCSYVSGERQHIIDMYISHQGEAATRINTIFDRLLSNEK